MDVLLAGVRRIPKIDSENLLFLPNDDDLKVWHVLALFPEADEDDPSPSPYAGGRYLFRLTAPAEFPEKPPDFKAMTPNGVFGVETNLCISIGKYHSGSWGATKQLGMPGFAVSGIMNGLVCCDGLKGGIGINIRPVALRQKLARESWAYNLKRYPQLCEQMHETALTQKSALRAAREFLRLEGLKIPEPEPTSDGGGISGAFAGLSSQTGVDDLLAGFDTGGTGAFGAADAFGAAEKAPKVASARARGITAIAEALRTRAA